MSTNGSETSTCRPNFKQKFAIVEWLRNNAEQILAERPRMAELAEKIHAEVGCRISAGTVGDLCGLIKLKWSPRFQRHSVTSPNALALRERIATLESRLESMEQKLVLLCSELNIK